MSDPYKVLGVSPTATDDQIKSAYRELAKKYHPDNYAESPLTDLASEKMKEINEAYDEVTAQRKRQKNGGPAYNSGTYGGSSYNNASSGYNGSTAFGDVRNLIVSGRIADAEQILDGVPQGNRIAEWYFLKGTVMYKRGWMEEAFNHFSRACQMDPGNAEYRSAMNQMNNQRGGAYGGYNPNMRGGTGGCDVCTSLCCADMCCECMGGDLIPCC